MNLMMFDVFVDFFCQFEVYFVVVFDGYVCWIFDDWFGMLSEYFLLFG